jgi:hypothetical protein
VTPADWQKVRHFGPGENWGEADRMYFPFVAMLDRFREFVGVQIVISKGTQGKHVLTSNHYKGYAGDLVFPALAPWQLVDLFFNATRFDFTEVGIYPDWKYAEKITGGMHLAFNPDERQGDVARKKYWIGTPEKTATGDQLRVAVTVENLRRYGFLAAA